VSELSLFYGAWFAVETGLLLAVLVVMVNRGVGWFGRSSMQRQMERFTGVVLIAFGIRLATEAR
jgi:threonine/homoserine/homoserine lactone efflux protein